MKQVKTFLDTSVLLSVFGKVRNGSGRSYIIDTDQVERVTFEKCIFECFLAFRGVGGKKPDEGRQDWAKRFLRCKDDPIPLGDATGKLHAGSLIAAHYWVGQVDEAQWSVPETFDAYMGCVKKYVSKEDWPEAASDWEKFQRVFANHRRYQALFSEFRYFLSECGVFVLSYEILYEKSRQPWRLQTMEGVSQRSTVPSEDFEIVIAALLSEVDVFVSADRRLLTAAASIETNLKSCDFVHLEDIKSYIEAQE
ncbi:hypothetical protein [Candidatus Kuenenia sp.]|uniref:hypothetical protein n=1 Tax=Candidatus Kuenenia sp. TaxID=2499824 RepID=UPI00321FCCE4